MGSQALACEIRAVLLPDDVNAAVGANMNASCGGPDYHRHSVTLALYEENLKCHRGCSLPKFIVFVKRIL